ncbi:MAG: trypsin-like peptidase domain-containing protein [Clostridiales bacterium]|nr:trypsin-like peptidase domain-containing protein [Clostridiales bacterium]
MKKWKKYGVAALSVAVLAGACAEAGTLRVLKEVNAQETEETQRVTLNIVTDDDSSKDEENMAPENSTGAEETVADENAAGTLEVSADEVSADEAESISETDSADSSNTDEIQSEESERVTLNRGGASSSDDDSEEDADSDGEAGTEASPDSADADEGEADTAALADGEAETSQEAAETANEGESEEIQLSTASGEGTAVSGIVTTDVSAIVEQCMSSIVTITCVSEETVSTDDDSDYFYYSGETVTEEVETAATGIIIAKSDSELLIATNYHVVSDAESLTVSFSVEAEEEELTVSGKVKGTSSSTDLAVVAVELSDIEESVLDQLSVATLGSSADLKVGQAAISISNALGYGQSVTVGVISALNREIEVDGVAMEVIVTDAAANLGSSGGALLNASGEVIGIGVAKETEDDAEGMAYAIPMDDAIPVLEQLINKETRDKLSDSERGYIGATVLTVSDEAVETYNMPAGAFVYEVTEGSAADEAGIMSGDIISGIEGESVSSSTELIEKMSYYAPGETITLEVQTANNGVYEARDVEVTLQAGSSSDAEDSEEEAEDSGEDADTDENEVQDEDDEIDTLPYDDSEDNGLEGFDDGFEDGFEDYNSRFN